MRKVYYDYLNQYNLLNYLDCIPEFSYSKKLEILKELKKEFSSKQINKALLIYKNKYIDINRIEILKLKGILKGLCKKA